MKGNGISLLIVWSVILLAGCSSSLPSNEQISQDVRQMYKPCNNQISATEQSSLKLVDFKILGTSKVNGDTLAVSVLVTQEENYRNQKPGVVSYVARVEKETLIIYRKSGNDWKNEEIEIKSEKQIDKKMI
jgi:hypothetical protein